MIRSRLPEFPSRKAIGAALLVMSAALAGCPPPVPQSITILNPLDLKAHDISLASGLASIAVSVNLTSSSGRPLQVGSFRAYVTEDLPGVGPGDTDELGNLLEQPLDISARFTVNYFFKTATLTTPLDLPMGWYFLQAKVRDNLNVEASDLVVFSVDYPGPLFIGSTNSPLDTMPAVLSGIYDECFGGAFDELWSEEDNLVLNHVPTFLEVKAAPFGLPVNVTVPPLITPSGSLTFTALVVNNAMLFPPTPIPPIDLGVWTNGLVPCEIHFNLSGVFRRTGVDTAAPRFVLQNVSIGNSPSGGTCWLPPPPAGCEAVVDMEAAAYYP